MMTSLLSLRSLRHAVLALSVLAFAPAVSAAPKPLKPRELVAKPTGRELASGTYVERIVVKFHEGSRVRLREHHLVALVDERDAAESALLAERSLRDEHLQADITRVMSLMERSPRIGMVNRLFDEAESALEANKATGELLGGQQLADLNLYFNVSLLPGTPLGQVASLLAQLNALDSVEVAYAQPAPEPASVNLDMDAAVRSFLNATIAMPVTPSFLPYQGYHTLAPYGIDSAYAWGVQGGRGQNVRIVDIEGNWVLDHNDLPAVFYNNGARVPNNSGDHGTAVLGVIAGKPDGFGVTGIAYQALIGVQAHTVGTATAISRALSAVGAGGIVLIEMHSPGPTNPAADCSCNPSQCNYIAVEYWQAEFDAIQTATANGVIVVEAAGNGSTNLDANVYGGAFDRNLRDSGAILVGASTAYTREPMCWTNHGSRVDLHGWGEAVTTLGYGDLFGLQHGNKNFYTSRFSGTSSASPIVVGAAASAQGVAQVNGRRLTSTQIRSLMRTTGTPQAADARQIGPLPNLRRILPRVISGAY